MIGLSTKAFPREQWMQGFNRAGLKCVEINLETSGFTSKIKQARSDVKPWTTYFKTSVYSGAGPVFGDDKNMRKSQEQKLRWEVSVAKTINARELVMRLDSEEFHKRTTTKFVKALNRKAVFNGVQLLLENNSQGRFSNVYDADYLLNQARGMQVCLNATNLEKSGLDSLEFIKPLNTRIKYVRVNNQASENIIQLVLGECKPSKWIITDDNLSGAMRTLQTLTSQGVQL